jgi:hypothetical protein
MSGSIPGNHKNADKILGKDTTSVELSGQSASFNDDDVCSEDDAIAIPDGKGGTILSKARTTYKVTLPAENTGNKRRMTDGHLLKQFL